MNTQTTHSQPHRSDEQRTLRQTVRQRRRQLTQQEQRLAAARVLDRLSEHERILPAKNIALFLSFDGELDTRPIIDFFWQAGKSLFLPILHPFSPGNLLFLRYDRQTTLVNHDFGLQQPRLDVRNVMPLTQLDVILTPLVAFDARGNRLGMGGGYYDRTLAGWQDKTVYPIGLAHDCQRVEHIDTKAWDIPLPEIITPSKAWRFSR